MTMTPGISRAFPVHSDLIQPLSRFVVYPLWKLRNHSKDASYIREAESTQYLPPGQLEDLRLARLRTLLIHAQSNCPFYARRFAEVGFNPGSVRSLDDLTRLPTLSKRDIQDNFDELRAGNLPDDECSLNRTGGSTGAPLRFLISRNSMYRRIANTIRHDRWAGLEPYHLAASLWGHRADLAGPMTLSDRLRSRFVSRRLILDASNITEDSLRVFLDRLRSSSPHSYVAYAQVIYLLARFIKQHQLSDYHRPKSIITSAEYLEDFQRELIETVFDCPVFNRYGCREFSVVASECGFGTGLHIAADTFVVEVVRSGGNCGPGEVGQLVITDLFNMAMPFIRYNIEDMGTLVEGRCDCGRTFPLMKLAGGRTTDFIVTPDRTLVSGASMTIYMVAQVPGIRQAQLVQKKIDQVVIRLVLASDFSKEARSQLEEAIRRYFGARMRYEIEAVDRIEVTESGKHRFSISEIDPLSYL